MSCLHTADPGTSVFGMTRHTVGSALRPGWKGVGSRSSSLGGERPPWGLLRAGLRGPEARLQPRMQARLPGHPRPTWAHALTPVHHAWAETPLAPHANMPAGLCGLDVGARGTRWPVPSGMARNPSWGALQGLPHKRAAGPTFYPTAGDPEPSPHCIHLPPPSIRRACRCEWWGKDPRPQVPNSPRAP